MRVRKAAVYGGPAAMVALCFANGLQQGASQSQSQAIESLKAAFHLGDDLIGVLGFSMGLAGAVGAVFVARLCRRRSRTAVLTGLFAVWTLVMGLTALAPTFAVLIGLRVLAAMAEATDPAALPLIADWWPTEQRARRMSVFQAGAGIGAFIGLGLAGLLVDRLGWQAAYWMWVPIGMAGTVLMAGRAEPPRGGQDVAFRETLARLEHDELVASEARALGSERRISYREVLSLRSWRQAALGICVAQIFVSALMFWGPSYFKRTFHLSGTAVGALAPIIGIGTFVGLISGGFIADRLLARGVLRARVWVSGGSYLIGGSLMLAALTSTNLWVAMPLLAVGTTFAALPGGPQYALLLDVTPPALRETSAAAVDVGIGIAALGGPLVGVLSARLGDLREALLVVSPVYLCGGALLLSCLRRYGADLADSIAEAGATAEAQRATPFARDAH